MPSDDLIARLQAEAECVKDDNYYDASDAMLEAADRIAALEHELAEMRRVLFL